MPGAGIIVMFSGLIANIPTGWLLCDGTFGTPDLREKFVRGTAAGFDPGDTGGAETHAHPFSSDGHDHVISVGSGLGLGPDFKDRTDDSIDTGTTDAEDSKPPYYDILFLMKA